MNQDQQPQPSQPWWKDNWIVLALVALVVVITTIAILGYWLRLSWTGFVVIEDKDPASPMRVEVVTDPKLFWDWLELLIIPIVLGAGALWFNQRARKGEQDQRQNELKIADEHRKEDALQRYLDRMSELVLDKKLRESKQNDAVRATARARTLTVVRSLDGNRKGQVVRFLYEADLIGKSIEESGERQVIQVIEAIIDLGDAVLNRAVLNRANLNHANLSRTNLGDANLFLANLNRANLSGAILGDADLEGANLRGANLSGAFLVGANLRDANLSGANLSGAFLEDANLRDANLSDANLRDAILGDAYGMLTNEQLAQAEFLVGATLPRGTKMTEQDWEEFRKRYRQSSQVGRDNKNTVSTLVDL